MPGPVLTTAHCVVRVPAAALARARDTLAANPLARRVLRRRAVAVALAALTGWAVATSTGHAAVTVARWGPTRPVVVARRGLAAGELVAPGDLVVRTWPSSLAPAAAVGPSTAAVAGRRVGRTVPAGVPLTFVDLADGARGPVAAALPEGQVGVTVGRGPVPAPVRPGDAVDVVGVAATAGGGLGGRLLARRAAVVAVDGRTVTLAVGTGAAPTVAAAGATGTVALVLRR